MSTNAQTRKGPVAKFSFNLGKNFDEISMRRAKLVGTSFASDRFGNENSSVFLHGHQYSYLNLGNYPALKNKAASISIWISINNEIWAGKGYTVNPVILTKTCDKDDFFEAYAIYYMPEGNNIGAGMAKDSTIQLAIPSAGEFERFKWHHLVMTYNAHGMAFYIDGQKQGEFTNGFEIKFSKTDSVLVGVTGNKKNDRFLNAFVDDIEFYDYVLTDNQVLDLYHAPNPNKNKIILKWALVCVALLLFGSLLYFLIKRRIKQAVEKERQRLELNNKLLETELRVNRASMNPHFLFNSLNALHNFILNKEIENASDYLVKFSRLLRKILDSNMYENISLELEIELLELYLEIENLRFEENIKYTITHDTALSIATTHIPIMMLQPFVENAIWHGLLTKTGEKTINISFSKYEEKYIYCIIEDNGTGRKKTSPDLFERKSMATSFILQRLELLNKIYSIKCSMLIEDKPNNTGTVIKIILPILTN